MTPSPAAQKTTDIAQTGTTSPVMPKQSSPSSMDDFELMPVKACLIDNPDCESCQ